eukprot:scaffold11715_cov133-Isochrysis_galbana.AAC.3
MEVVYWQAACGWADRLHGQHIHLAPSTAEDRAHCHDGVAAPPVQRLGHAVARTGGNDRERHAWFRVHHAVEALVQQPVTRHRHDAVEWDVVNVMSPCHNLLADDAGMPGPSSKGDGVNNTSTIEHRLDDVLVDYSSVARPSVRIHNDKHRATCAWRWHCDGRSTGAPSKAGNAVE